MAKTKNRENSWLDIDNDSDFSLSNLPFGVFKTEGESARVGTILGEHVIDLAMLEQFGYFSGLHIKRAALETGSLNNLIATGKEMYRKVRSRVKEIFTDGNDELRGNPHFCEALIFKNRDVEMLMPVEVGDYTDFYSSREHATNAGTMFRGKENALMPNWLHIPVGYHGRSSSIIVSGKNFHRPKGQMLPDGAISPVFGPTRSLDFELEVAFITCGETKMGESLTTEKAEDYIFGMVLFNDWSARDIQKWEYVPLGPFLGKNFASSISPWVVTLDALELFRVAGPKQEPEVLPYLKYEGKKGFDINLEVYIHPEKASPAKVCKSNFKYLYWNMCQQLAHHTVNGCNIRPGDMFASGTISGPAPDSFGSMLELAWKGTKPIKMSDGTERSFIHDGDTVIINGFSQKGNIRVGFGEVKVMVLPAL